MTATPAAYRYTEARLTRLGTEMMADHSKDTVDFQPNYDDRFEEPTVLPAGFPNLLVSLNRHRCWHGNQYSSP